MDWIEVKVHTTTAGADLVSEQLMQEGATGTMVEDRADVPDPDKPTGFWEMIDPDLIQHMPEDVVVHAWFEPDHRYADRMQALLGPVGAVAAHGAGHGPGQPGC